MSNASETTETPVLPDPTTKVAVADGDELDVWVLGEGEPVVLIHGAMTRDLLLPLGNELVERGHQVIHYGRRGHGGGGLPRAATDIAGQADDVVRILDALGIARAHVAGHSFGGFIALDLAIRTPHRLLSAILFEAIFPQALSEAAQQEMRQLFDEAMPAIVQMYVGGEADRAVTTFFDLTAGVEGSIDLIEPLLPKGARQLAAVDLDTFLQVDTPAMFSWTADPAAVQQIATPIEWVSGTESAQGFQDSRAFLQALLPDTTTVEIPDVGHYFPLLKATETATAVTDWLTRQRATSG